jgi:hypothetical protein
MQRTEMVALVAGATVGLGGGGLGAFLVCRAGQRVVHRFMNQIDDQYLDLRQPDRPTVRHNTQQASLAGSLVTQPASDQPPKTVPIL